MTDAQYLILAAGTYGNRLRNLKKICKTKGIKLPKETPEGRQKCIESIFNQFKSGELRAIRVGKGFKTVRSS